MASQSNRSRGRPGCRSWYLQPVEQTTTPRERPLLADETADYRPGRFGRWLRRGRWKVGRSVLLLYKVLAVALTLVVLLANFRLYMPAKNPSTLSDVDGNLAYLSSQLEDGLGIEMQQLFPEGYFFSFALYGLSWVNVGLNLPVEDRAEAVAEARWALSNIEGDQGKAAFSASLDPPYGMFYVGWANYLRSGIVALQKNPPQNELAALQTACDEIVESVERAQDAGTPFVASYPGEVWPVDTFPAMVSVKGCATHIDPSYEEPIARWLEDVTTFIEKPGAPSVGLLPHRTEPRVEGPRATSQTLIIRFMYELDPGLALEHYDKFRSEFMARRLGLPVAQEFPTGTLGVGDVDSGPLIAGASASATVVSISTAQVVGDRGLAQATRQTGQAFGFSMPLPGGDRYLVGLLPIGDAFVVWSSTSMPWFQPAVNPMQSQVGWWWRWPTHGLSIVAIGCLTATYYSLRRITKRSRR